MEIKLHLFFYLFEKNIFFSWGYVINFLKRFVPFVVVAAYFFHHLIKIEPAYLIQSDL
jgi:hypothetical protein